METVVERALKARVHSSGKEIAVRVLIGRPHWTIENTEAACPLTIEGFMAILFLFVGSTLLMHFGTQYEWLTAY